MKATIIVESKSDRFEEEVEYARYDDGSISFYVLDNKHNLKIFVNITKEELDKLKSKETKLW
jgi:hypothetical protein